MNHDGTNSKYPKTLNVQPISFREACQFVEDHHRHHPKPQGHKFSIAVNDGSKIVGVIMVERPVARGNDDTWTLEVTRCCTDGTKNAASKLYASAVRASKALGFRRLITYMLDTESGTSLIASGWKAVYDIKGRSWSWSGRPRYDKHPTANKTLWQAYDNREVSS